MFIVYAKLNGRVMTRSISPVPYGICLAVINSLLTVRYPQCPPKAREVFLSIIVHVGCMNVRQYLPSKEMPDVEYRFFVLWAPKAISAVYRLCLPTSRSNKFL